MHTPECTHLQASLKLEMSRRWRLELEVFDARSALAMARTQLARTERCAQRARHQAMHDGLTALPNRAYFTEQLDRTLSSMGRAPGPAASSTGQALAVLFLDLDGFKSINDTHGHFIGDEVLSVVAARLDKAVRADDVVCRFGGDEFAFFMQNLPQRKQLSAVACKLFDTVSAPLKVGQLTLTVLPSIGVASYPHDGLCADALLKHADTAMYQAKRSQTGYAFFTDPVLS